MKLATLTLTLPLLLAVGCASTSSDVKFRDFGPDPMSNEAFMNEMTAAMTPGPEHAEMAKGVGFWRVEGTCYMAPGGEGMPMTGTANVKTLLGGRYLMQEFRGEWMGESFDGILLMGYDNLTQQYWNLWIDSMSTGYSMSHGVESASGDIEMSGEMRDVFTPGGRPYRSVMRVVGPNEHEMTMYDTAADGTEFVVMRMTYRR